MEVFMADNQKESSKGLETEERTLEETESYPENFGLSPGALLKAMHHIEEFCGPSDVDVNNYVQTVLKKIREMGES